MNNDIRPPQKPDIGRLEAKVPEPTLESPIIPEDTPDSQIEPKKKWLFAHKGLAGLFGVIGFIVLLTIASVTWYFWALSPVDSSNSKRDQITIVAGSSPNDIADNLKDHKIIRSALAFDIYTRITGTKSILQAGTYSFAPSESTPQIVDRLTGGDINDNEFNITFYPGATLIDDKTSDESKRLDVKSVLLRAGYNESEIADAFSATYTGPLFSGRPSGMGIEGYVYGETYRFNKDATVKQILQRTFDEFYSAVAKNDLINKFKSHELNLYQGITLASIVQREAHNLKDQKQIAQVFYTRLGISMALGSDVTYQYIADKTGVPRDTNLDSPYNTRRYAGLPPGPIASPGYSALQAVAEPASGDYLYFLAGDDNIIYFSHTNAEHESNIVKHCRKGCSEL